MRYNVDGFDVFDPEGVYEKYLGLVNGEYDQKLLAFFDLKLAEDPEFDISFLVFEVNAEHFQAQLEAIHKMFYPHYAEYLRRYNLAGWVEHSERCFFCYLQNELRVDLSKCRLSQLANISATKLDAAALANRTKPLLFGLVYCNPALKTDFLNFFETFERAVPARGNIGAFFDQFMKEISLLKNARLRALFESFLNELVPVLEIRLDLYEEEAVAFGCSRCTLCQFEQVEEIHKWFGQFPELRTPEGVADFHFSIFRRTFYRSLTAFLRQIKSA